MIRGGKRYTRANLVSRYAPYEAYPCSEPDVQLSRIRLPTKLIVHIHVSYILTYILGLARGYTFSISLNAFHV